MSSTKRIISMLMVIIVSSQCALLENPALIPTTDTTPIDGVYRLFPVNEEIEINQGKLIHGNEVSPLYYKDNRFLFTFGGKRYIAIYIGEKETFMAICLDIPALLLGSVPTTGADLAFFGYRVRGEKEVSSR